MIIPKRLNTLKRLRITCKDCVRKHHSLVYCHISQTHCQNQYSLDGADSGSSPIDELMCYVHQLSKASESVYRRLEELKTLLKSDPAKPKDKELDGRIEENLASVFQMKDLFSSVEPRKKRLWNDLLAEMANDLSKRSRRRVVTQAIERHDVEAITQGDVILDKEATYQDVVNPDQKVISQESSSVDQDMSSQDTETDDEEWSVC